jgi:hypothetical protein
VDDNQWMEFSSTANGANPSQKYYHNFTTSRTTTTLTPTMTVSVAPITLKTHTNVLRKKSDFMPRLLRFRSWWTETHSFSGSTAHKEIELIVDTLSNTLAIKTLTKGAPPVEYSCDNVDGLTYNDFHCGRVVNIMGRETTCMQASLETQRWYDIEFKKLSKIKSALEGEVKKYDLKAAMSRDKAAPVKGSRVKSLRYLIDECEEIATKLYQLRPNAVKKVLEPYT